MEFASAWRKTCRCFPSREAVNLESTHRLRLSRASPEQGDVRVPAQGPGRLLAATESKAPDPLGEQTPRAPTRSSREAARQFADLAFCRMLVFESDDIRARNRVCGPIESLVSRSETDCWRSW